MAIAKKRKPAPPAAAAPGAPAALSPASPLPAFIDTDLKLLLSNLTTPETPVKFDPTSRSTPGTIQNTISPPQPTWTWPDATTRGAEVVSQVDIGKYGLQTDINTLFRLISASPNAVWQPVTDFTNATWTWPNQAARIAQTVLPADVNKIGLQSDIDTYYVLTGASPPVWQPVTTPLELSTGAADADSYHDFFRLQIAFEDVWAQLIDDHIGMLGQQLYAYWDALMDQLSGTWPTGAYDDSGAAERLRRFAAPVDANGNPLDVAGVAELQNFLSQLQNVLGISDLGANSTQGWITANLLQLKQSVLDTLQGCNMLMDELNRVGTHGEPALGPFWNTGPWMNATAGNPDPGNPNDDVPPFPGTTRKDVFNYVTAELNGLNLPTTSTTPTLTFPDITQLLQKLDGMLKERYRFDVFAPASINYGLLLNYRQHWQPQSYQVGNLVSTIPLAPQETRKYTTKTVIKKSRNIKEINDSVRSGKNEADQTSRTDAEIVDRAKNDTNFKYNASGTYGNDALFKVQAGTQGGTDHGVESAQTKRDFHEAVVKSAQEYRNENRMEVSTEESREDETTSSREIRNPNDELAVTYLFYELQRRFLVSESLYRATPVILVANDVPAPHEVDQAWILRYDWIIKRAMLDDSFLPALEYLSANYAGEEVTLLTLEMAVQHQKTVVDKLSQQVMLANQGVNAAVQGLQDAQNQSVYEAQAQESMKFLKNIIDPLGIGQAGAGFDGNSDRARLDFAKDALTRAQTKADQLTSDMKSELSALQVAIDKYTAAATRHYGMLADIDRLRLHVKDNIIHYMQAIWTYEPPDQRYFRLYNLDVPVVEATGTVQVTQQTGIAAIDSNRTAYSFSLPQPVTVTASKKLHQVADVDRLLGFKGNYMIFPLVDFDNYMAWYLMQNYIHFDDMAGVIAADPDPNSDMTLDKLKAAMTAIANDPTTFATNEPAFEEVMMRLLSDATQQMVIVPSNSLYIEALPGTHPLLEDFKLIHRALDIKKVQAEVRKAEIENLRVAARLENTEYGDPHIDKVVVVEEGQNVTVDAGQ